MYQSDSQKPVPMNDSPNLPHARESAQSILGRAKERLNSGGDLEAAPDETLQWVHDSWIGECEAAGLYSRKDPVFDDPQGSLIAATLTAAEVKLLAQRHLNTVIGWNEFFAWNGLDEWQWEVRAMVHETRFRVLSDLLSPDDQRRFWHQIEIRERYVRSVEAEVTRCEKVEQDFWNRVNAGLVSEADIAAHKTPSFIAGLPVMPPPADGGHAPEEWNLFSSDT